MRAPSGDVEMKDSGPLFIKLIWRLPTSPGVLISVTDLSGIEQKRVYLWKGKGMSLPLSLNKGEGAGWAL